MRALSIYFLLCSDRLEGPHSLLQDTPTPHKGPRTTTNIKIHPKWSFRRAAKMKESQTTMLKGVKHALPMVCSKDMRTTAEIERVLPWISNTSLLCPLPARTYMSCAGYNHAHTIPICPPSHRSSTCCHCSHMSPHLPPCCLPPQLRPPGPCPSQCGRLGTSARHL